MQSAGESIEGHPTLSQKYDDRLVDDVEAITVFAKKSQDWRRSGFMGNRSDGCVEQNRKDAAEEYASKCNVERAQRDHAVRKGSSQGQADECDGGYLGRHSPKAKPALFVPLAEGHQGTDGKGIHSAKGPAVSG